MFGYDVCTYLLGYHKEWDNTVVPGGFSLSEGHLNVNNKRYQRTVIGIDRKKRFILDMAMLNILNYVNEDIEEEEVIQDFLYLNQIPNDVVNCICVYDTGSFPAVRYHADCKPLDTPTVQVRIRNESLRVAEQTAYKAYTLLDEVYHDVINGNYYVSINAVGTPTYLGCDQVTTAGTAHEFTLNLNSITKRR